MPDQTVLAAFSAFRAKLPAKARLYAAGCSGEPLALAEGLKSRPDLAAGLTFLGIWIPGVNQTAWADLHDQARAETIFLSPAHRGSFDSGQTAFRPLTYTQSWPWLQTTPLDGAVIMISPPDETGTASLGVSADFSSAVLKRADIPVMAIINPSMPKPRDGVSVDMSRFSHVAEADTPLIQIAPSNLPESFSAIGLHIAGLIDGGDTLQFGLGNVQQAVLEVLRDHQNLRIHSGMVSDPVVGLIEAGALANDPGAITTGVAIGTDQLYTQVADDTRIHFRPVSHTHALPTLAAIDNFKAINSAIEVDLFGQANAEFIGGKQVSGTGGLVDFMRGAAASEGGRAMTALASTARKGTLSRIVPRLAPAASSIARADMDTVITEHGIAELKGKTIDQRAQSLIEVADPGFRDDLSKSWDAIRSAM